MRKTARQWATLVLEPLQRNECAPASCAACFALFATDPDAVTSPLCDMCAQDAIVALARAVLLYRDMVKTAPKRRARGR
jgi:hypothetical protein